MRKMLLLKGRCFLYELGAYLIYVKVGDIIFCVNLMHLQEIPQNAMSRQFI